MEEINEILNLIENIEIEINDTRILSAILESKLN